MPVCWFCGDNVPDVTKCPKCGLEYCELHTNQHDCPGVPVTNPYNIPAEKPTPAPAPESESVSPEEQKPEVDASREDLESKEEEAQPAQEETPKEGDAVAKTVAGLKKLNIHTLEDLEKELKKVVPVEKYAPMVREILEAEDETMRRLKETFNDLSIGKLTSEILNLAIVRREKNKLSWDETCELACSILALAAPRIFPSTFGDDEQMAQITLATTVVGKILDRKEKTDD